MSADAKPLVAFLADCITNNALRGLHAEPLRELLSNYGVDDEKIEAILDARENDSRATFLSLIDDELQAMAIFW